MPLVAPTLTGRIRMRIEHVGPFRFQFRQPAKLPAVVAEDGAKDLRSRFPVFFPNPGEPFHDGVRLFAGDSLYDRVVGLPLCQRQKNRILFLFSADYRIDLLPVTEITAIRIRGRTLFDAAAKENTMFAGSDSGCFPVQFLRQIDVFQGNILIKLILPRKGRYRFFIGSTLLYNQLIHRLSQKNI